MNRKLQTILSLDSLPHLLALMSLLVLIALGSVRVHAQDIRGVVKANSIQIYRSLPDYQKSEAVGTLAPGTVVRIEWSVTNAQGDWCNVSAIDRAVNLGFVDCNALEVQAPGHVSSKDRQAANPAGTSQRWTRAQKDWGLAASALLTEFNHERHDTLAGAPLTAELKRSVRQTLNVWWDIKNREDLLAALTWIDEGGHRQEFSVLGERISELRPEEVTKVVSTLSAENAQTFKVSRRYYQSLGRKSITGWDYARYISLCRWGYGAGYLSEEEAWEYIMSAARTVQDTFSSWQEFGENYLIGREFWSPRQTQKDGQAMRAAYQRLLNNSSSPWNRIPWSLDLR